MDKMELLNRIESARAEFEAALMEVTKDSVSIDENWSVKDLLAHIGFWEHRVIYLLGTLQKGEEIKPINADSIDEVNAAAVAEHRERPYAEVRKWEADAYRDMLGLISAASEDDLFSGDRFAWTKGKPFVNWIAGNSYEHYEEHLPSLRAAGNGA